MLSWTTKPPDLPERRVTSRARPSNKGTAKAPTQKKSQLHIAGKRKTPAIHSLPNGGVAHASVNASPEREELLQAHGLIAQIWHRNKNQHRGQKWWKWVAVLKRAVRDLVELTVVGERNMLNGRGGGGQKVGEAAMMRKKMEVERARREQRGQVEEWLREVVLGRCWLAFSTLIADSQFSTLGVVLLAILARVGKLVGLPTPLLRTAPELKSEPRPNTMLVKGLTQTGVDRGEVVERACDNGGPEDRGLAVSGEESNVSIRMPTGGQRVEEVGKANSLDEEAVTAAREDNAGSLLNASDGELGVKDKPAREAVAQGSLAGHPIGVTERRKKRRKKGNAIDELFAGLS